jgi:hypothetical protein
LKYSFQHVNFVLPNYDIASRKNLINRAMDSSALSTRAVYENGQTLTKGEMFGPTSSIDIEKPAEFIRKCTAAAATVKRMPKLPLTGGGLAVGFTQLKAILSPMPHSQAADPRNSLHMFA